MLPNAHIKDTRPEDLKSPTFGKVPAGHAFSGEGDPGALALTPCSVVDTRRTSRQGIVLSRFRQRRTLCVIVITARPSTCSGIQADARRRSRRLNWSTSRLVRRVRDRTEELANHRPPQSNQPPK